MAPRGKAASGPLLSWAARRTRTWMMMFTAARSGAWPWGPWRRGYIQAKKRETASELAIRGNRVISEPWSSENVKAQQQQQQQRMLGAWTGPDDGCDPGIQQNDEDCRVRSEIRQPMPCTLRNYRPHKPPKSRGHHHIYFPFQTLVIFFCLAFELELGGMQGRGCGTRGVSLVNCLIALVAGDVRPPVQQDTVTSTCVTGGRFPRPHTHSATHTRFLRGREPLSRTAGCRLQVAGLRCADGRVACAACMLAS